MQKIQQAQSRALGAFGTSGGASSASGGLGGSDATRLRALIVDETELSRSVMSALLRQLGLPHGQVNLARNPEEARRMIKAAPQPYDIIVTDFYFLRHDPHAMTGRDLLDELRQARGLPMQTAFLMVTDEARYQHVADAVEGALDDYLLKPFTAAQFEDRLRAVLERKNALREVFQAIEAGDYEGAAGLCETMFRESQTYKVYAARIGSELYLRLNKLDAARRMFEALLAYKAVPWARLGLARIDLGSADPATACRTLETLLAENPGYADAYDVYGRALLEDMNFEAAIEIFAKAVQITPGNVSRLQKLGSLQLFLGHSEPAAKHLAAALNIGAHSRVLDYQGLVALAVASYDVGLNEAWERAQKFLAEVHQRHPDSYRLRMLRLGVDATVMLAQKRQEQAQAALTEMAGQLEQPGFTFEMAATLIQLLVRCAGKQPLPQAMAWVQRIGERFCVSKPRTRLLELAAAEMPAIEDLLRETAARINEEAREAMSHLVSKQHQRTLDALTALARRSLNARIITLARATLAHHGAQLPPELAERHGAVIERLHAEFTDLGRQLVERRNA